MPEPLTHILFFLYVFSAVAIYAGIKSHITRRAARKNDMKIIMVMAIGGFCAILPDIDALYNYVTMGQLTHGNLMPVTHNLLASYFAFMFATWIGYIVYLNMDKAAYVGVLGSSAYISHLLLDDIVRESVGIITSSRSIITRSVCSQVLGPCAQVVIFYYTCLQALEPHLSYLG